MTDTDTITRLDPVADFGQCALTAPDPHADGANLRLVPKGGFSGAPGADDILREPAASPKTGSSVTVTENYDDDFLIQIGRDLFQTLINSVQKLAGDVGTKVSGGDVVGAIVLTRNTILQTLLIDVTREVVVDWFFTLVCSGNTYARLIHREELFLRSVGSGQAQTSALPIGFRYDSEVLLRGRRVSRIDSDGYQALSNLRRGPNMDGIDPQEKEAAVGLRAQANQIGVKLILGLRADSFVAELQAFLARAQQLLADLQEAASALAAVVADQLQSAVGTLAKLFAKYVLRKDLGSLTEDEKTAIRDKTPQQLNDQLIDTVGRLVSDLVAGWKAALEQTFTQLRADFGWNRTLITVECLTKPGYDKVIRATSTARPATPDRTPGDGGEDAGEDAGDRVAFALPVGDATLVSAALDGALAVDDPRRRVIALDVSRATDLPVITPPTDGPA